MGIAKTGRVNLRTISITKWTAASGQSAIVLHAYDLACMTRARRDIWRCVVIGDRHVQHAVAAKVDARGKVSVCFAPIVCDENILHASELVTFHRAPAD